MELSKGIALEEEEMLAEIPIAQEKKLGPFSLQCLPPLNMHFLTHPETKQKKDFITSSLRSKLLKHF